MLEGMVWGVIGWVLGPWVLALAAVILKGTDDVR